MSVLVLPPAAPRQQLPGQGDHASVGEGASRLVTGGPAGQADEGQSNGGGAVTTFADAGLPPPFASIVAVGTSPTGPWELAPRLTDGRLKALGYILAFKIDLSSRTGINARKHPHRTEQCQ